MRSELGWSDADTIVVRGFDLPSQLLGHVDFGGMAFLELMAGFRPRTSPRFLTPAS